MNFYLSGLDTSDFRPSQRWIEQLTNERPFLILLDGSALVPQSL